MQTANDTSNLSAALVTVGGSLKSARIDQGMTVDQVAELLNLSTAIVECLETGQLEQLPNQIFAFGHLRSYGKLVNVDTEGARARPKVVQAVGDTLTKVPLWQRYESAFGQLGVVLGGVFVLVASYIFLFSQDLTSLSQHGSGAQSVTLAVDGRDQNAIDQLKRREQSLVEISENGTQQVMQSELLMGEGVVSSVVPASLAAVGDLLTVSFSGNCWVEVVDAEGKTLVASMKRANENLQLLGKAPFSVLLGFAPAAKLQYNGDPVEIARISSNNSARILVGDS